MAEADPREIVLAPSCERVREAIRSLGFSGEDNSKGSG